MFFKKKKINLKKLYPNLEIKEDYTIQDVKPLRLARKFDLTFFDSIKYKSDAISTKSLACITTQNLQSFLPKKVKKIIFKNVLMELCNLLKKLYTDADFDVPDSSLNKPKKNSFKNVKFGNNVLIGKNVKIGINSIIGSNTIIEHNVVIGKNCFVGHGVIIKNSLIGDNVIIQDGNKIGQKGFGFIPIKGKNIKFPHIGKVIVEDNVEIASNCTIDRGSVDDTIIGKNTYLDNQVHVAHNVKIGANCMIAGQVGFAGSSTIGSNVSIGGQAGISGHLTIGNNVKIGGGSGVVKDVEDNQVIMGYPATKLKNFLKKKYE